MRSLFEKIYEVVEDVFVPTLVISFFVLTTFVGVVGIVSLIDSPKNNVTQDSGVVVQPSEDYSGKPVDYNAMAELINIKRSQNGLKPLYLSKALNQSAQLKADDMHDKGYWAHDAPDGTEPWHYFKQVGYDYRNAGENLAKCYYTPETAVEAWWNSPVHKKVMLGDYTQVGFGTSNAADGCLIIVSHYGRLE